MTTYKTRAEGFSEIRQQILLKGLPLWLLALGVGYGMSYYNSGNTPEQEAEVLPIFIPLMLAALGFGIYRSIMHQKKLYDSYTLTISDTTITRELSDTPPITIPVQDITSITRNHNGTFTIKGNSAQDVIGVYKQVDPYEVLEAQLNIIQPITIQSKESVAERLRVPIVLLTLALLATVYIATNKVLVGVSGAAMSALMIWTFFYIQRSPHLDRATKRRRWWMLLVLFSIIATTIVKLLPE